MSHYPNPFDFVPFAKGPLLKTTDEWLKYGDLQTGYLDLQIKALTPIHIVGNQDVESNGQKIKKSHFYRRHGSAYIPGASIRGLLRSFIEAACNGWASQITPYYKKEFKKRHIDLEVIKETGEETVSDEKQALPKIYYPDLNMGEQIDLASFLFGYVSPQSNKTSALRGSIKISDAMIDSNNLGFKDTEGSYELPDIIDEAFMGGPKPSASSWWYLFPHGVRKRKYKVKNGKPRETTEFIGRYFRGRKFYFHQNPQFCLEWYKRKDKYDKYIWPTRKDHPLYFCNIECLKKGSSTEIFRIYFDDLPNQLLNVFLLAISPGDSLCHKIGYGKSYGFGSIQYNIMGGSFRKSHLQNKIPIPINDRVTGIEQSLWDISKLEKLDIAHFIHWESINYLARILWYDIDLKQVFTYPPFKRGGFQPSVDTSAILPFLSEVEKSKFNNNEIVILGNARGKELAKKLSENYRPALDFEVYQENSEDYNHILNRSIANVLTVKQIDI